MTLFSAIGIRNEKDLKLSENGYMNKFFNLLLLFITSVSICHSAVFHSGDKLYIDDDEFTANTKGDEFYIHTGNNIWLVTHSINRDSTGLFAYEANLCKSVAGPGYKSEYERKWKCPYCYNYWAIGTPCQNTECPSKYK